MAKSVDDRGPGARLARRDEGAYCCGAQRKRCQNQKSTNVVSAQDTGAAVNAPVT